MHTHDVFEEFPNEHGILIYSIDSKKKKAWFLIICLLFICMYGLIHLIETGHHVLITTT